MLCRATNAGVGFSCVGTAPGSGPPAAAQQGGPQQFSGNDGGKGGHWCGISGSAFGRGRQRDDRLLDWWCPCSASLWLQERHGHAHHRDTIPAVRLPAQRNHWRAALQRLRCARFVHTSTAMDTDRSVTAFRQLSLMRDVFAKPRTALGPCIKYGLSSNLTALTTSGCVCRTSQGRAAAR